MAPFLLLILILTGCVEKTLGNDMEQEEVQQPVEPIAAAIPIDDKRLYEQDQDDKIKTFYLTILPNEKFPHLDWDGLNEISARFAEEKLNVILSEGAPNGVGPMEGMFGANETTANASISIRGNSSRSMPQKSYKIKLKDHAGNWQDQQTININKHISDSSRLTNKLSFDLMETIPNISSIRTQFIHLYVKDATAGSTSYVDYGLYTQMEQPNKQFLGNHLFDPNGYLYKVTFFEFDRYPDKIRAHTDEKFDRKAFESILEIKGRDEHDKLIAMLNDVNDYSLPINEVVERHFDEENILTWAAVNLLMDNMDTDANNFFLYSPLNADTWLILPWDYDGGWDVGRSQEFFKPYQYGISHYWGNRLLNRYFRSQENVDKLTAKMEELYGSYINEETVQKQLDLYAPLVKPYVQRYPDNEYLPSLNKTYDQLLTDIVNTPKKALQRYYEDLEKPKPFFMTHDVLLEGNEHVFGWGISFDLQGDELYYDVTIAQDPELQQVVHSEKRIRTNKIRVPELAKGVYYWKVTVTDAQGNTQTSFDMYKDRKTNIYHFGILRLEVE